MKKKTKFILTMLVLSISLSFFVVGIIESNAIIAEEKSITSMNIKDTNIGKTCKVIKEDFSFHSGISLINQPRDSLVPFPNNRTEP